MGMSGYDRILVEPSGIYDVDEFFDTLYASDLQTLRMIANSYTKYLIKNNT